MRSFEGKKIIITGAGSGIGLELLRQIYPHTRSILAVDSSPEFLTAVKDQFPEVEGVIQADLSLKSGNQRILNWVKTNWDQVDFCFANAGKAEFGSYQDQNWREMELLFQLNVFSPIQLGLELKAYFSEGYFRHVITCSAMAFWALPGYSLYGATKAALLKWAEAVWAEKSGEWLTLAFPIATLTGFFRGAGKEVPKAFPVQHPNIVAKAILEGASSKKTKIFPSFLFRLMWFLDQFLFFLRPLYLKIEYHKFKIWLSKQSPN